MIFWHIPMFFMYAIDQLGAKLYEPHETNEDWIEAHRYFQVTNALLMRMSNTTSNAVTTLFISAFTLVCIMTINIGSMLEEGSYQYVSESRQLLIRASAVLVMSWIVTIAPAVLLCR
mmetsp:Transcript_55666/g.153659  ORF Transcript_55666/g.153659 Transcript_55666/m.153659 type:complete len:117 (+) Transcript_55666:263-613(+)